MAILMRKGKVNRLFYLDRSNYEPEPFEVCTIMPVAELLFSVASTLIL